MQIKICGITSLADALEAVDAGATMLGFNFHPPSPRCISPDVCRVILSGVRERTPDVAMVGVFVNRPVTEVIAIADRAGLDLIQLSGDEPPADLARLGERAFKAIRPNGAMDAVEMMGRYASRRTAPVLLVDAIAPAGQYGGTGLVGNWAAARAVAEHGPILLAGGLNPGNVAASIATVRPWGVDVASGVESQPGRKDPARMRAFVAAALGATLNAENGENR